MRENLKIKDGLEVSDLEKLSCNDTPYRCGIKKGNHGGGNTVTQSLISKS